MYFEDFSDIASFVMPQYVDSNSLFSILCRRLHKKIYGEPLSQKGKQYHLGKRHRLYSLYTVHQRELFPYLAQCRSYLWILSNGHLFQERTHKNKERVLFVLKRLTVQALTMPRILILTLHAGGKKASIDKTFSESCYTFTFLLLVKLFQACNYSTNNSFGFLFPEGRTKTYQLPFPLENHSQTSGQQQQKTRN